MPNTYRLTRKRIHRIGGDDVETGETFEPTDAELQAFGDRLEPSEDTAAETTATSDSSSDGFDVNEWYAEHDHWREVVTAIEDGEVDDHLDAVREAEQARDSPRDSVLDAIDEREG